MGDEYFRFGSTSNYKPDFCYLCDKKLDSDLSQDHIIPDRFFLKGDPERPKLLVHRSCNINKSLDDQWFLKVLHLKAGFNPDSAQKFSSFMDEAIQQKKEAYLIGGHSNRYKLARSIFDQSLSGLVLIHQGQNIFQIKLSPRVSTRFEKYLKTMCRGLFISNVMGAHPNEAIIIARQYVDLDLHGGRSIFFNPVQSLFSSSQSTIFGQRWLNGRVMYFGSRVAETANKGYVFVEFYGELGILAAFS